MGKCASAPGENTTLINKYTMINTEENEFKKQSKQTTNIVNNAIKETKMDVPDNEETKHSNETDTKDPLINILADVSATIQENAKDVENKINNHFDELIQALTDKKNQLIETVNTSISKSLEQINHEIETIPNNDNINAFHYLKYKIKPLNRKYLFNPKLDVSSITSSFRIDNTSNHDIVPNIYLYSPELETTQSSDFNKYCLKFRWYINKTKLLPDNITQSDALTSVIKYRTQNSEEWIDTQYDKVQVSYGEVECTLKDEYCFIYGQQYEFKVEYTIETPIAMTIVSDNRRFKNDMEPRKHIVSKRVNYLMERVELFVSINDIVKKDILSASDPFVVVYIRSGTRYDFEEIGRTEVIYDTHNPKFSKQFKIDYYFEEEQILRFDVYDQDKKESSKLTDHDCLGSCTMKLGEIIHENGMLMAKKLIYHGRSLKNRKTKRFTRLTATIEKINETNNQLITMQIACHELPKMDGVFGKCDPYFLIQRVREDDKKVDEGTMVTVYGKRNEYIKNTLNPTFPEFQIETQLLCNNDEYRPIIISLFDWDRDGGDDLIGTVQTSLHELKTSSKTLSIMKKKHNKDKQRGELNILKFKSQQAASFLDYMKGTVDLEMMFGIDFTKSNGDPKQKGTLHYLDNGQPSKYQSAIREIGNIISSYATDPKYPVWGFGALFDNVSVGKEHWNGIKHDFNLNIRNESAEVEGVHGIEEAYLSALNKNVFSLSGPTLFQPILEKCHKIASIAHMNTMKDKKNNTIRYFILLFITDGVITDMKQTKDEIVSIANEYLPMSIIIVGVGNSDFSQMNELDGDDIGLKNSKGEYGKRDIVQFVPMNKFRNLSDLAQETLFEVPRQFLSYVRKHDIAPKKKLAPKVEVIDKMFVLGDYEDEKHETLSDISSDSQIASGWDNAPLPRGWERVYDEKSRVYYVNVENMRAQWKHPSAI